MLARTPTSARSDVGELQFTKTPYIGSMKWKELEDYDWFPPVLRKYQMQYIGVMVQQLGFYKKVIPVVNDLIQREKITEIVDLCSGSGVPALVVHKGLTDQSVTTYLTDKYPQTFAPTRGVHAHMSEQDVLQLTPKLGTLYTMYNAFHHFQPEEQAALLQKIIDGNAHLLVVEVIKPNLWNALLVSLASTLGVWVFFWWIKPFEWRRFVFSYVLPINILTILIDGLVSILKSKSAEAYRAQLEPAIRPSTALQITEINSFPAILTILKITPAHA
jgi:hypothetical protein